MLRMSKALILLLWIQTALCGQVKVGQLAPNLVFGQILQGSLARQDSGRPMVLEFWATWCGPCVQNIPHLNQLARQFQSRGLEFVSITPEDAETVERFLQAHPIQGVVALDPGEAMLKLYGAGTPTTILIDRSGRVVRKVHPSQITEAVLEDLVSDRPVQLPAMRDDMYPPQGSSPGDASTIVKITVSPTSKHGGMYAGFDPARGSIESTLTCKGETLLTLLSFAYELPSYRIFISKYFQGGYYAVDAWVPSDHGELLRPMLKDALEAAIDYRPKVDSRGFDVLVLEGLPGKLQPATSDSSMQVQKGLIAADSAPLTWLAKQLEDALGRPIVVDHLPPGYFRWKLQWNANRSHALEEALSTQLGLKLRSDNRVLPVLVIDTSAPKG
jgi:uncharacterized protein (TIGR03435 family)